MSLLDRGNQCVVVYPEEKVTDADGNTKTQAAKCGFRARARIQPLGSGGAASADQYGDGFDSEKVYSLRFPRGLRCVLGAQSQIEWMGERWVIHGDPLRYSNSPRTAHLIYTIKRH